MNGFTILLMAACSALAAWWGYELGLAMAEERAEEAAEAFYIDGLAHGRAEVIDAEAAEVEGMVRWN